VTDPSAAAASGVTHAEALIGFADALVGGDEEALARARARLLDEEGPEGLVDAAAVASNFERMVRIADSTGIPLDGALDVISTDLRQQLRLDRFGSSANTPGAGAAKRVMGSALRPLVRGLLWVAGARRRRARAD
jgi:hypothetical protein